MVKVFSSNSNLRIVVGFFPFIFSRMRKTQTNYYKNKLSLIIYWLQLFLDLTNYQVSKQPSFTGYLSPGHPWWRPNPRRWSCLFLPDLTSTSWTSWSSFLLSWINPLHSCYLLLAPTLTPSLWSHWLLTSSSVWEMQSLCPFLSNILYGSEKPAYWNFPSLA